MQKHETHYKTQDGRALAYGEFHDVSPRFAIKPYWPRWNSRLPAFAIKRKKTGEVKAPPHSPPGPGCDALMMALYQGHEPEGYISFAFGHEALKDAS